MYYFSDKFITDLTTVKSQKFQDKFFEIIDSICRYFDKEEEKRKFQTYIEEHHSYDKPGNLLFSTQVFFGGKRKDIEKLKKDIHFALYELFDDNGVESGDALLPVSHIVICLATNAPLTEKDMDFLKSLINFERVLHGVFPALVTTILNVKDNTPGTSLFVAGLK